MRRLTGADALMLYSDTPRSQQMVIGISIYDPSTRPGGTLTLEDVTAHVASRLDASEVFREVLVRVPLEVANPVWIRDGGFDVKNHVRAVALPAPGTWRQFCTQVARLGQQPIDLSCPPWELWLIEGLDAIEGVPRGSVGIMLKLHHAAVDGVRGSQITSALTDLGAEPEERSDSPSRWTPESRPSDFQLLRDAAVHVVTHPMTVMQRQFAASQRTPFTPWSTTGVGQPRPEAAELPATRFNGPVSAHRAWDTTRWSLAEVRGMRGVVPAATVNDVVLAVIGGALRRYLDDLGELPPDTLKSVMPVSLRPTAMQPGSAAPDPTPAGRGGNTFAMVPVELGTDIAEPLERLRSIQRSTAEAKSYATDAPSLVEWSELVPGAVAATAQRAMVRLVASRKHVLGAHLGVTNVPGPQLPVYLAGAKALFIGGVAPLIDGMGLMISVGSYAGEIYASFTVDRDMMPDPDTFTACLEKSFAELRSATA
jgi:diacylglycerol O-acyltransferase / wax synthase